MSQISQPGCSIRIQTLLYHNQLDAFCRSLESVIRTVRHARRHTGIHTVTFCVGDCSSSALLDAETVKACQEKSQGDLVFEYTFFGGNLGTSRGHNSLAKGKSDSYVLVMNPDIVMWADTLHELLLPFQKEDQVGMVEARQTPLEHPKDYDPETGETDWATTACVLIQGRLFEKLQGFDEKCFFMYCDDVDFSWRVRLAGYKVLYQPAALAYHDKLLGEDGEWLPSSAEVYYSAEASLMMAYKWSFDERLQFLLKYMSESDNPKLRLAAQNFRQKQEEKTLSPQMDAEHKVGALWGDHYARHRFDVLFKE